MVSIKLNRKAVKMFSFMAMILCHANVLPAQSPPNALPLGHRENIPSSPEAALFGRFGDVPVGGYTGTADISIPLYTIKVGSNEIPLTLRYHSSGIKVADEATWVGLGWDLLPGGCIIQEVRGIRDYYDNNLGGSSSSYYTTFKTRLNNAGALGAYKAFNQAGRAFYDWKCPTICVNESCGVPSSQFFPPTDPSNADYGSIVGNLLLGNGDPDIYHFSFGSYSGKFYINPETNAVVIIDKQEEIFFEFNAENSIQATTLDGTRYVFSTIESSYEDGFYDPNVSQKSGRSFKLTSIYYLDGRDVQFEYIDAQQFGYEFFEDAIMYTSTYNISKPLYDGVNKQMTKADIKILTKITTPDAIIDFNLSDRADVLTTGLPPLKRLTSIDIRSRAANQKVKSFEFIQSYFPYNDIGTPASSILNLTAGETDALGKRLRLDAVKEIGYDINQNAVTTKPPYLFEYNLNTTMPLRISFAKDMWGYYNGIHNNNLLPDMRYFDYPDVYLGQTNNNRFNYNYPLANRYSNNTKADAYILKKITYPTGGFNEFDYEPNSFTNKFIPDQASPVYKSYTANDNSISATAENTAHFKISKSVNIHFENRINNGQANYNPLPALSYAQMAGCYIKLIKYKFVSGSPQITILKQWDLSTVLNVDFVANGGKSWNEDVRVAFDPDPDPSFEYRVLVNFPDNLNNILYASIAGVSANISFYDDTGVDISQSVQCGIRVKEIRSYTQAGTLAGKKSYKYFEGKLLNEFMPIISKMTWSFMCTGGDGSPPCHCPSFLETESGYTEISINSNFIKEGGNMIGYGRVEETELNFDGSGSNGKKSSSYFNLANSTSQLYAHPILNQRNGLLTNEKVYDNNDVLLLERTIDYTNLLTGINCYYGLQIVQNYDGNIDPFESPSGQTGVRSKYSYYATPILAEHNMLSSVIQKQYAGSNSITTTETYTYNSEGSLSTKTLTGSKNEEIISRYYYPQDQKISPAIDNAMIAVHNTGTPVVTEQFSGVQLLSRERIVFGSVASAPALLPQYYFKQVAANPEVKLMTINSYDNKGNITQYTGTDNIPVSLVWNADKTLTTAKVVNATYASLLALPGGLSANFRTALPAARVTTFTYRPLIGVTAITDINNKTISYEYDEYGRLKLLRDQDNNVIKTFDYKYGGIN